MSDTPTSPVPVDTPQSTMGPFHVATVTIGHDGGLFSATVPDGGGVASPTGLIVRPGTYIRGEDIIEALRRMPPSYTPEQAADWFELRSAPTA